MLGRRSDGAARHLVRQGHAADAGCGPLMAPALQGLDVAGEPLSDWQPGYRARRPS